jgi:dCMP deaminase
MLTNKDIKYMKLCRYIANTFSTCGKKKYAAVILDINNHVIGMGYNGGPSGMNHCEDGGCPRFLEDSSAGSIYDNCIAVHAEQNALLHCNYSSGPDKIYVNGPPCFTCAKLIANSTIKNVYYIANDEYKNWPMVLEFLNKCNININKVEEWQLEN